MNKRIAEMAEEAAEYALLNQSGEALLSEAEGCDEIRVSREFIEKFAELIVRECVKVMYDNAIERKVPPDINQTPTHYAIAVLEHFGVEE